MTAFDEAFQMLKQNFRISNLPPHIRARNLPDMSPQRFIDEGLHRVGAKNYTRDFMPGPSRYDDEGFPEYDGEDLGPPYGKPEFGDEDARQAEMNEAERAAIMAEGMPEMRKPRSAPRPGDPRFRGSRRSDAPPNSEGFPKYFNSDIEPTGIAIHDSAHNQPRPKYPRDIFGKAWDFLKADESYTGQPKFGGNQKQPLDMHEYPPGSGNFMTLQDMLIARNADARKNMQNMTPKPRPTGGNTYDKRPSGWQ